MSVIIQTEVFTLSELVDRGDDRAVDRALEWVADSLEWIICEDVDEDLKEVLRSAGLSGLSVDSWVYHRSCVNVSGRVDADDVAGITQGHPLSSVVYDPAEPEYAVSQIEGVLSSRMLDICEYMTSRDYLLEIADLNGYTFTVDGKRFG